MAGKRTGAVIRTYGRLRPIRRLESQKWLSPGDRKHLFSSSSSSSSHLSTTCEPSPDDSDFLLPKRKRKAVSKKRQRPSPPPEKSPPISRKRRKKKSLPKVPPTTHDKENGPPPRRSPASPAVFTTPFKRHVTFRRKAPAAAPPSTMRRARGRPKRSAIPPLLSDSFCDFEEVRKSRRLPKDVPGILDSSADALLSPLQRTPLLSSTPSVQLTAMPRSGKSFVRQMALCEPLEESMVTFCTNREDGEKTEALSNGDLTGKLRNSMTVIPNHGSVTQHCDIGDGKHGGESGSEHCVPSIGPGSGVKCLSIKMSRGGSPLCLLSPVLVSSPESPSVICLGDGTRRLGKDGGSFLCASAELFSHDAGPSASESRRGMRRSRSLAGSPSSAFLKRVSSNKVKNRKSFQPVVKLSSEDVEEYLQRKMGHIHTQVFQKNLDKSTNPGKAWLPPDVCLRGMQPVVRLDRQAVTKYFEKDTDHPVERTVPRIENMELSFSSPALQSVLKTPLVSASVMRSRIQASATSQAAAGATTGRKVCISGFSAKRWGTQKKKTSKTSQQLSFQDYSDSSMLLLREGMSGVGLLSPSFLFSSSMITSSFLNSSAVRDLNLSTDLLSARDHQRDQQRWARLRAALSLHRKKRVQAGGPADQKTRNKSMPGNQSSLLLLSPFQASLCSEDLTDEEKVLAECQQEKAISFYRCLTQEQLRQCQKVGEGVYGEVFRTLRAGQHVALKVIPIEGTQKVNGEAQKSFAEILPEIIISKELSLLSGGEKNVTSGFIKLHSAYCVQGSYPLELLSAWDDFAEEKGSENDRPDLFGEDQLFMILEFEFGGDDLERMCCKLPSVSASRSILHQVTAALAVAEEELRFEHRDLHWGNILIEKCSERTLSASLQGETFNIASAGVQVKIIDYTLSRLDKDGLTVFCDLSTDEELFQGEGDLQFEVYRSMREENQNDWSPYQPHSNVLWLHYLCDKLLREVQYVRKPTGSAQQRELRRLRDFRKEVLDFCSASDVLLRSKLFN